MNFPLPGSRRVACDSHLVPIDATSDNNAVSNVMRVRSSTSMFALLVIAMLEFSNLPAFGQSFVDTLREGIEEFHPGFSYVNMGRLKLLEELPSGTLIITGSYHLSLEDSFNSRSYVAIVQIIAHLGGFLPVIIHLDADLDPATSNAAPPNSMAQLLAAPAAVPEDASGGGTSVSRDGTTVVGYYDNGFFTPYHAFVRTEETGIIDLGTLDPPNNDTLTSFGTDVSTDGSVVVGSSQTVGSAEHAFRWTQPGGMIDLGTGNGPTGFSRAHGVNGDGSVVVGESDFPPPQGGFFDVVQAFRWTEADGLQTIGGIETISRSIATAVTADGSVIVGRSTISVPSGNTIETHSRAFRWTESGGMQNLGVLPGYEYSTATAVSDDGTVVVGVSSTTFFDNNDVAGGLRFAFDQSRAFYWTESGGMQDLTQLLADAGMDMSGKTVVGATSISADGEWIGCLALTPNSEPGEPVPAIASLTFTPPDLDAPPAIVTQPFTQAPTAGDELTLTVDAQGPGPFTYQWFKDGVEIADATTSTYFLPSLQRFHAGDYRVTITNANGSVASNAATVSVNAAPPSDSRLLSLSTRALSLTGDDVLIPGFAIQGTGTKRLLIRAVGPTLGVTPFNLGGVMPDPQITLKRWNGTAYDDLAAIDNWVDAPNAAEIENVAGQVFAFALQSDLDAAMVVDLAPGTYTAVASGVGDTTGIAIVEFYDADTVSTASMTSISNRGFAGIGNDVMIPGFVVSNEGSKTFLIRVAGPTLAQAPYDVPGTMDDPVLTVFRRETNGTETNLLSNDNWSDNPDQVYTEQVTAQVFAFELQPGSLDAAIVATLEPGVYTVVGSAADGVSSGVILVEVYAVE